jgi:hypothetical protein
MPWARVEPTIPAFKRAKTAHALDRAATLIGSAKLYPKERMFLSNNGENIDFLYVWQILIKS